MSKEDVTVEHRCPKCGKPMFIGKLTGDTIVGQGTLTWIDNKKGWRGREHLDSLHNPKGVRAYARAALACVRKKLGYNLALKKGFQDFSRICLDSYVCGW